jgi:plastocyanin
MQFRSMAGAGIALAALVISAAMTPQPEPAAAGTVRGTIRFAGGAAPPEPVDMSSDAVCAAAHGGGTVRVSKVKVTNGGELADAIVYVKDAPRTPGGAEAEPVLLDQRGCIYEPHVVALRVGQPLRIRNSDPTLHNVHVRAEHNREFNIGQPIQGLEVRRTFTEAEVGIDVSCDVHGWMSGVIAVFDHPYFAVSGADGGFALEGLPAGTYTVEVWHETLGVTSRQVTVPATGDVQLTLEFGG